MVSIKVLNQFDVLGFKDTLKSGYIQLSTALIVQNPKSIRFLFTLVEIECSNLYVIIQRGTQKFRVVPQNKAI